MYRHIAEPEDEGAGVLLPFFSGVSNALRAYPFRASKAQSLLGRGSVLDESRLLLAMDGEAAELAAQSACATIRWIL